MTHRGEGKTNGIRCRFNPSCGSIFKEQKSAQTPASNDWGKLIRRWEKCFCLALTHRLRRYPLSRSTRVNLWMLDSVTSPSAPRRMTAFLEVFRFHI